MVAYNNALKPNNNANNNALMPKTDKFDKVCYFFYRLL